MSRNRILLSALFLISISFWYAEKPVYAAAGDNSGICSGVSVDQVDVSGMTEKDAQAAVTDLVKSLQGKVITITVGNKTVDKTMGDLGYTANVMDVVEEAVHYGRTGNLIKRYKELKDAGQGNVTLPLTFTYDESKIKNIVKKDVSAYNMEPVNAGVSIKNGKLLYTDEVSGSKVNVEDTTKLIIDAVKNWNRQDITVNSVVDADMPVYTKDIVQKCDTVLGSYTTQYASSAQGRAANLANGARLINNTVIYPGETFSAYKYLSPFTVANGYYVAGAYLKGKVIDSVGGGACQVTTTLYNAVLNAELEIIERQSHSMTISYVDLSRDAAIAGTSKDFKFKNNTDVPILIQAWTQDRRITFRIWGHETRDTANRTIKFVTKILSKTNPSTDVVTKDPSMPTTYRKVTTPAHIGYRAQLYKVIYENGAEVSRTLVNTSYYQAAARCITIGTKVVKEEEKDTGTTDTSENKNAKNKTDANTEKKTGTDSDSVNTENLANPDGQVQGDIWDPALD